MEIAKSLLSLFCQARCEGRSQFHSAFAATTAFGDKRMTTSVAKFCVRIAADDPQEDLAKFGCKPKVKFEKYPYIFLASLLKPVYKNLAIWFWVIAKVVMIDRKI